MKVLMITPDAQMIDRRIILEARSLVEAGHDLRLLAGFECAKEEEYEQDGIKIHRYQYDWCDERIRGFLPKLPEQPWLRRTVATAFRYFAAVFLPMNSFERYMYERLLWFDCDIIQVHDLPCLKSGYYAAKKKNVPLFFDAHELYYAQDVLSPKQQKDLYRTEKKYAKYASEVFTVNPFIADIMAKRDKITTPHVILNATKRPIDTGAGEDILRKEAGLSKDKRVVLYQGWISPERNIDKLVKSVPLWKDGISLVLVGYGDYVATLQEISKQNNTEDRITFLGEKANSELYSYTKYADLGVIPYEPIDENHLYCSPNKLFEYVIAGLPFICNNLPFLNYIGKNYGVLAHCSMGDETSIAETVNNILGNPQKLAQMKDNCVEAAQTLNWSVEGDKLVQVYAKYQSSQMLEI